MYRTDRMDSVTLICGYAISGVVASVMLCLMNTWLFVAGILISATPLICSKFFTNMQRRTRGAFSARSEEYANVLKETVDGYEVIHTSNQSGNFLDRFEEASAQKQRAYFSYGFARNMSAKTLYTVASLANIIGVGVGGFLILQGSLSAAMMLAATGYFSEISNSLSNLIEEAVTFRSTKELAKKLEEERNFPVRRSGAWRVRRNLPLHIKRYRSPLTRDSCIRISAMCFGLAAAMRLWERAAAERRPWSSCCSSITTTTQGKFASEVRTFRIWRKARF